MSEALSTVFADHRRFLWGLSYRMLADAAEAEDVVQETFARALERPPADTGRPWRPWLVRVAMNLSRDRLRARRRREYRSFWLPQPVPSPSLLDEEEALEPAYEPTSTEARYELMESISYAFLVALEALTPRQRAVLLLRDAYGYSVAETAAALDMSEANVKTTLHRARQAIAGYERIERPLAEAANAHTQKALERFLRAVASGDDEAMQELLVEDVRVMGDGGGRYVAAPEPVVGRERVIRFCRKLGRVLGTPAKLEIQRINGRPAVVMAFADVRPGWAPRSVMSMDVDASGRIVAIYNVLADAKLTAISL